jgi:hypothetical protein
MHIGHEDESMQVRDTMGSHQFQMAKLSTTNNEACQRDLFENDAE